MMKTRSMKDTAASSKGDGNEETNATALVAKEHVEIQEQDDSEETLSIPRGQAAQAATGTEGQSLLIQFLNSLPDKLGFLQAIEEGIRGINKKLNDNNQHALEMHQATLDSRAKNQEQLLQPLEKVQPRGGSSPMVLAEDTTKTLGGAVPKSVEQ